MNKVLESAKAYAALLGAIITAVLGTVPPHTTVWTVLTVVSAVLTAVATYSVPNAPRQSVNGFTGRGR